MTLSHAEVSEPVLQPYGQDRKEIDRRNDSSWLRGVVRGGETRLARTRPKDNRLAIDRS
jgi:hypothetical protein